MRTRPIVCILFLLIACLVSAGAAQAEPNPGAIRNAIRRHILAQEQENGVFTIQDDRQHGAIRSLQLVRVHDRVGKTGEYYYSCTDMRDLVTGDLLDLDFDVEDKDGELSVVDVRIHKDNMVPRYTYDDNDNMISIE